MSDLNDLKLQGRIVKDAAFKETKTGKKVALFTLAVNRTRKNQQGEFIEETDFFPVSAFVRTEKFSSYLKKGQPLILEGYLKQVRKEWTDESGTKKYSSKMYICTSRIHLIFTGKKEPKEEAQPANENFVNDDFYIEEESQSGEDVFIGDEQIF